MIEIKVELENSDKIWNKIVNNKVGEWDIIFQFEQRPTLVDKGDIDWSELTIGPSNSGGMCDYIRPTRLSIRPAPFLTIDTVHIL